MSISTVPTHELAEWKKLYEKWNGIPYSYKAIVDELEIRERSSFTINHQKWIKDDPSTRSADSARDTI